MGYLYDEINYYAMSGKEQEQEQNMYTTHIHPSNKHAYLYIERNFLAKYPRALDSQTS